MRCRTTLFLAVIVGVGVISAEAQAARPRPPPPQKSREIWLFPPVSQWLAGDRFYVPDTTCGNFECDEANWFLNWCTENGFRDLCTLSQWGHSSDTLFGDSAISSDRYDTWSESRHYIRGLDSFLGAPRTLYPEHLDRLRSDNKDLKFTMGTGVLDFTCSDELSSTERAVICSENGVQNPYCGCDPLDDPCQLARVIYKLDSQLWELRDGMLPSTSHIVREPDHIVIDELLNARLSETGGTGGSGLCGTPWNDEVEGSNNIEAVIQLYEHLISEVKQHHPNAVIELYLKVPSHETNPQRPMGLHVEMLLNRLCAPGSVNCPDAVKFDTWPGLGTATLGVQLRRARNAAVAHGVDVNVALVNLCKWLEPMDAGARLTIPESDTEAPICVLDPGEVSDVENAVDNIFTLHMMLAEAFVEPGVGADVEYAKEITIGDWGSSPDFVDESFSCGPPPLSACANPGILDVNGDALPVSGGSSLTYMRAAHKLSRALTTGALNRTHGITKGADGIWRSDHWTSSSFIGIREDYFRLLRLESTLGYVEKQEYLDHVQLYLCSDGKTHFVSRDCSSYSAQIVRGEGFIFDQNKTPYGSIPWATLYSCTSKTSDDDILNTLYPMAECKFGVGQVEGKIRTLPDLMD